MMIVVAILVLAGIAYFAVSAEVAGLVAIVGLGGLGVWIWGSTPPPKSGGGSDPSAINFGR